jgi:hypothetical protein
VLHKEYSLPLQPNQLPPAPTEANIIVSYNGFNKVTIRGQSVSHDYKQFAIKHANFFGFGSKDPINGKQVYIDCDLGEAYITDSDIMTKGGSAEYPEYRSTEEDHFVEIAIDTSKIQVGEEFTCERIMIYNTDSSNQVADFSNLTFEKGQENTLLWESDFGNRKGNTASIRYDGVTDKITIATIHIWDANATMFYYPPSLVTWTDFVAKVNRFLEPSDNLINVNDCVSFGASLPVLKPGETIITKYYDDLDGLKIKPRWWKV